MKYLWRAWPELSVMLQNAVHRLFLFDFDGTLAPIVKLPSQARVSEELRRSLRRLASHENTRVGVLSGRSLTQVREMVAVPSLIYGGNHGQEISGAGRLFKHPQAGAKTRRLKDALVVLRRAFGQTCGVLFENKGLSLSVHYRNVADRNKFKRDFKGWLRAHPELAGLRMREGKCVFEFFSGAEWNKGSALKVIRQGMPSKTTVLYAGDDFTDEDAFAVLKKTDIGIHVGGNSRSRAVYYLRSQQEVRRLLRELGRI